MKSEIEVLAIGSSVLVDGDIPARILAFEVRGDGLVTYQCAWWDERKRQMEWLTEAEIKPRGTERTRISITRSK
jgi:hypothetical protein